VHAAQKFGCSIHFYFEVSFFSSIKDTGERYSRFEGRENVRNEDGISLLKLNFFVQTLLRTV
jgi:hypothetical protein